MWQLADAKALLWLLVPVGLAAYFWLRRRPAFSPRLLAFSPADPRIRVASKRTRFWFRCLFGATLLGLAGIIVAIARPVFVENWTRRFSEGIDIAIVLDVSESMEATDLVPNRMTAAKQVIRSFIEARPHDRIGLIIFGGEAITKCPLTRDHDFLIQQVEDSRMRELKQGTAIGMGLSNGISRLRNTDSKTKIIVLITDGDSNVGAINPVTAANLARQEGIKIYSIGIGKEDRVVVPIYAYDSNGRRTQLIAQVPSYINPQLLAQISNLTGGNAYMARDTGMLFRILQEIDRLERNKIKMQPQQKRDEQFFFPAALGTLLLLVAWVFQETRFRKVRMHAPAV